MTRQLPQAPSASARFIFAPWESACKAARTTSAHIGRLEQESRQSARAFRLVEAFMPSAETTAASPTDMNKHRGSRAASAQNPMKGDAGFTRDGWAYPSAPRVPSNSDILSQCPRQCLTARHNHQRESIRPPHCWCVNVCSRPKNPPWSQGVGNKGIDFHQKTRCRKTLAGMAKMNRRTQRAQPIRPVSARSGSTASANSVG